MSTPRFAEAQPPLVVHLTRMAGCLTLLGGVVFLVAANAVVGVCIVLLSALYFALAEIIRYLAIIARQSIATDSTDHVDDELAEKVEFNWESH